MISAFLAAGALLATQSIGNFYLVINNTSQEQTCSFKTEGGQWRAWVTIGAGENWRIDSESPNGAAYFQCRPPVLQRQFTIYPTNRYSLLPSSSGEPELVEVTGN